MWKKVRSWLYENVSYISWSHITPRLAGFWGSALIIYNTLYLSGPTDTSTSFIQNVFPTRSFASTAAPCKPVYVHLWRFG